MRKAVTIPILILWLAPLAAEAQDEGVVFERDPRPKIFATDFTWYRPNEKPDGKIEQASLACTRSQPARARGEITATDYLSSDGYYGGKYRRFRTYGVDGIAFLVNDRIPDSFSGSNLTQVAGFAVDAGLEIFAYYDLLVTARVESNLLLCLKGAPCHRRSGVKRVRWYHLVKYPELYDQLRDDFIAIGEYLVLPYMAASDAPAGTPGYSMLVDAGGRRVLDEEGLPRPILAIYIARELSDRPANTERLRELMAEVTEAYRAMGIGKPALVLDVLFWVTPRAPEPDDSFDPDLLDAFEDYAVAVTWYGFFDTYQGARFGISNDGPRPPMVGWARALRKRYFQAVDELTEQGRPLMVWPGVQTQIDRQVPPGRGCSERSPSVVYQLRDVDDWRFMLRKMRAHAWRPKPAEGEPWQTVLMVNNAGEWFETGGIDRTRRDRSGSCSFPYNWCDQLLEVLREQDRYP